MGRSVSEILGEYIAYMILIPLNGFMCLLAGDSDREWCTMAQQGFIGWSIVVLPILLINLVTWASRQGRPLVSFLGAACAVVGAGLILYLFRGPLFGLLQAGAQIAVLVCIMVIAVQVLLRMGE
jgi:hypothetical protein